MSEVVINRAMGGEKTLRMARGRDSSHLSLSLSAWEDTPDDSNTRVQRDGRALTRPQAMATIGGRLAAQRPDAAEVLRAARHIGWEPGAVAADFPAGERNRPLWQRRCGRAGTGEADR